MDDEGFRHYLKNDYSGSLSDRAIGDVISRCRRIENALNVNLAKLADVGSLIGRVDEIADGPDSSKTLRNALYRYRDFTNAN